MSLDFIALDFETANQARGSVIQLGIARILDGKITKTASTFITPPPGLERFDWNCTRVHGIKPKDVVGAPDWPSILARITKFAGNLPLLGHNVSVERSCIVQASAAHGITPPAFDYFCTLKVARQHYNTEPSHSLGKLSASIGLPAFAHHEALADAVACANLVLRVAEERRVTTLGQLGVGWLDSRRRAA